MMALLSNWNLKHENNEVYIYEEKQGDSGAPWLLYAVSDLDISFGTTEPYRSQFDALHVQR